MNARYSMTQERMKKIEKTVRFAGDRDAYEVARRRMVTDQIIKGGVKDAKVLDVMGKVPRHMFVSHGMENQAYLDRPLQIGFGQTISQPLIVAMMTELLALNGTEKILEIGTGSGYQAAILSALAKEVYSIERIKELSVKTRKVLYRMGYSNIFLKIGDGTLGWPEKAPFDAIIVTAGAPVIPENLMGQLADGGRMVVPVGGEDVQYLEFIRNVNGVFEKKTVTACRFVKLIGESGWKE